MGLHNNEHRKDGRTLAWANNLTLKTPTDIARLPWKGSHYSDTWLFHRCHEYIRTLTDFDQQRDAIYLTRLHGLDIQSLPTTAEVGAFMRALDGTDTPTIIETYSLEFSL